MNIKSLIDNALLDQRITSAEADDIVEGAAGADDAAQEIGRLLTTPGVTFEGDAFARVKKAALSPGEALWATYFPNQPMPQNQAMKRALTIAVNIPPLINDDPHAMAQGALRTRLNLFEGLLDLYRKAHPSLTAPYREVKKLEDTIGKAREPGEPEEVQEAEAKLGTLVQSDWKSADGTAPALRRALTALAAAPLGTDEDDRAFLQKQIAEFVHGIGSTPFNMNDLQGPNGIHDLRKQVRWVAYFLDLAAVANGPKNLLPEELVSTFDAANDALSDIKDRGEEADALARRLVKQQGIPYEEARVLAAEQLGPQYAESALFADAAPVYESVKSVYSKYKDVLDKAPAVALQFNAITVQALEDKRITETEAKEIVKSVNGDSVPLRGVLAQAGVDFALAAKRTLNRALPPELRVDTVKVEPKTSAERMWVLYFPGEALPTDRGTQRFLGLLSSMQESRQWMWSMECLLRLYKGETKKDEHPEFDEAYAIVKRLEDAIGKTAEPATQAEKEKYRKALEELREREWTPDASGRVPALGSMLAALTAHDFGSDAEDDKRLTRATLKQVKKIGTKEFDMKQLQGDEGIHELRRQLRWPSYNLDVVARNGGPAVGVPKELMSVFDNAHMTLGNVKDRGEEAERRARELIEKNPALPFEEARKQATKELGPSYGEEALVAEAEKIYQGIKTAYAKHKDAIEAQI